MTDPDKRNIEDERYHHDAAVRHAESTEPRRSNAEWLLYFKQQFHSRFIVTPPAPGGQWRAVPTTGGTALFASTATELLAGMRISQAGSQGGA
jgi:hypothetical protein